MMEILKVLVHRPIFHPHCAGRSSCDSGHDNSEQDMKDGPMGLFRMVSLPRKLHHRPTSSHCTAGVQLMLLVWDK